MSDPLTRRYQATVLAMLNQLSRKSTVPFIELHAALLADAEVLKRNSEPLDRWERAQRNGEDRT